MALDRNQEEAISISRHAVEIASRITRAAPPSPEVQGGYARDRVCLEGLCATLRFVEATKLSEEPFGEAGRGGGGEGGRVHLVPGKPYPLVGFG